MARVIVLAGGGTGGHVFPAIALADAIRLHESGVSVRFLGTERGIGGGPVRAAGYAMDTVPSAPVVGRGLLQKVAALWSIARGALHARRLLRETRASLVIGVGGYASVPAVLAAVSMRIPSVLLEADAQPGRANRFLGHFARLVFVSFEDAIPHFPAGKAQLLGFPVRAIPPRKERQTGDPLHLLVIGGSQGAHSINTAFCESLAAFADLDLRITHQTGAADCDAVRAAYQGAGLDATVAGFFDDMPERIADADLVVARAGASSVAEFCTAGLPQILIPYPHAAGGHQMRNARELERGGMAVVIPDAEAGERLAVVIQELAGDRERRARMGEAARRRASPDAALRIWNACRSLIGEQGS